MQMSHLLYAPAILLQGKNSSIHLTSDSQPGVCVPLGVQTRTFRGTRKKLIMEEKGHHWAIYLQLQDMNLK